MQLSLEQGNAKAEGRTVQSDRRLTRCFALFLFAAEMVYGLYLGYFKGVLLGDAVSRTANAFYVLNVRPYRFASMGLVWNPLPSTLQLPFIALAKFWRPFASQGVGASILTAAFAAWGGAVLLGTFLKFRVSRTYSLLMALLYALHPYVFFYGANGMSESISFCFTMLIICGMTLWMQVGTTRYLLNVGMGFVGLFYTRYESIPFAMGVALGIVLTILFSRRERRYSMYGRKRERYYYIEGTLVLAFTPMVYAVLIWVAYNWVVTGNPLYFMNSGYSMLAYSAYYSNYGDWLGVLMYLWVRTWPFLAMVGAVLAVRLLSGRLFRLDTLIFLICSLVLTVFQYVMMARGASAAYVRYMCYPMIIAMAWIPYELGTTEKRVRGLCKGILAGTMAVSCLWFGWAFQYSEIIREDTLLMLPEGSGQMADYINSRLGDKKILMDAYRAYDIFMNLDQLDNVVISSSEHFYDAVSDPAAYGVEYVLVPESGSYGDMDAMNIAHRELYYHGAPWCVEEAHIGEFKLFRVTDRVRE